MKKLIFIFLCFPILVLSQNQIGQDIDGEAAGDGSGSSVALSSDGTIVAIGAPGNDDNGMGSGSVRVFKNVANVWTQIGKDIDGKAASDLSGESIALSSDGTIVVIGAPLSIENGLYSGQVRIYQYDGLDAWIQLGQDFNGEIARDFLGSDVALSSDGSIVAIGVPLSDGNGDESGHVAVYQYNNIDTWLQIGEDIVGEVAGDRAGGKLALSSDGNIVAIGSRENDDNGNSTGSTRIFQYITGVWTQLGQDIDGDAMWDYSGSDVAISSDGSIVAIGSPGAYQFNDNLDYSGKIKVFQYNNNIDTWIQIGQDIYGEAAEDRSGLDIDLSSDGSIIIIGAKQNDGNGYNSGHARVYQYNGIDLWNQLGIDIDGEAVADRFGSSVAISSDGSVRAIGGRQNEGNGDNSGHVRVYDNLVLSLDTYISIQFKLYPNPTSKDFTIVLKEGVQLQNVNIYNELGQQVLTSKNLLVDTSKLASGLYVVEIGTNKGKGSKKLIIE